MYNDIVFLMCHIYNYIIRWIIHKIQPHTLNSVVKYHCSPMPPWRLTQDSRLSQRGNRSRWTGNRNMYLALQTVNIAGNSGLNTYSVNPQFPIALRFTRRTSFPSDIFILLSRDSSSRDRMIKDVQADVICTLGRRVQQFSRYRSSR